VNVIVGASPWLVGLLGVLLAAAAVEDALRLRISNITCLAVLLTGVAAMALRGFPAELWQNAVVFAVFLALGTAAFAARAMGGGDIKLLAAIGIWMSFWGAAWLLAAVFIAGGVLAVIFILTRVLRSRATRTRIPYGLAIVAGAALVFVTQMGIVGAEKPKPFTVRPFVK
jgi:prepilin peptidase CpaA